MTEPILYKGTFVVDEQSQNEPFSKYIERILFNFEEHIGKRVPVMSQGHYQTIEVEDEGDTEIKIKAHHRITNVAIKVLVGIAPYTHNFKLVEARGQDNKDTDKVIIYIAAPASTNPTIRLLNQDNTVIYNKTFNGSGNDSTMVTAIKLDDSWRI